MGPLHTVMGLFHPVMGPFYPVPAPGLGAREWFAPAMAGAP